ncbi:cytadherence high molecular weight protein 1-like [Cloeon dipterum]|uniref:cytadherence high molecular weight protein 1-like n=1 Tax=Cloeon dipterum TaxID=197152 RepID=UPI00322035FD
MILVLLTAGGVFLVVLYNLLFKKNTPIEDDKKNILPMSELPLSETYPPVRSEPPPLLSVHAPEIKVNVETTAAPAAPVEEVVVAAPAEAAVVFATPAQAVLPPQEENWVIEADELTVQSTGTEVLKVADLSTPSIASCSATLSEIDNTLKRLESRITSVVQDSNELTADEESYLLQNTQDLLLAREVAASAAPVSSENESAAAGKGDEEAANILRDVKPTAEETTVEISQPTSVSLADIEQQIIALAEKEVQFETKIEAEISDAVETVVTAEPEQKTSVEAEIVPAEVQTGIFQATPVAVAEEPVVETPVPTPSEVSPVEAVAPEPEPTAPLTPEKESVVAEIIESVNVSTVEITVTEPVAKASDPVLESVAPQADKVSVEAFKTDDSAEIPKAESPILESVVVPVTGTPETVVEPTPTLPISEVIAQESIPLAEAVVPVEEIPIAESVVETAAPTQVPEISLSESVNISVEEPKSIDAKEDPGSVEPFPAVEEVSSVSNISDSAAPGDIAAIPLESALETKAVVLETSFVPETHQLVHDISAELTDAVETLVLAEEPQKPTTEATSENVVEPLPVAVETAIEPVIEAPIESRVHEVVSSEPEIKSEEISEPMQPDAVSSKISETKSDELLVEAPAKSPSTPDNSPVVSVSIDMPKSTVNVSSVSEEVDSVINEAVDILEKRLTEQVEAAPEASKHEPQLDDISDNSPVTQTEIKEEKATESLVELVIEPPKESAGSVPESSADKAEIKLETLAAAEPLILDEAAKAEEKVEGTPKPAEVATSLLVDLSEPKAAVEVDLESFVVVPKEKQVTADIDNVYTLIAECQSGATKELAGSAPSDAPINSPTTTVSNPPTANEAANAPSANE